MRKVDDGSLRIRKNKDASDYNLFKVHHYYGPVRAPTTDEVESILNNVLELRNRLMELEGIKVYTLGILPRNTVRCCPLQNHMSLSFDVNDFFKKLVGIDIYSHTKMAIGKESYHISLTYLDDDAFTVRCEALPADEVLLC